MKKMAASIIVLFNASVVLAGLKSSTGGSAKLLSLSKKKAISGTISEIVFDEVVRNSPKIGLEKEQVKKMIKTIFPYIFSAPKKETVDLFRKTVIDDGDAHVLATCREIKAKFLVSLDKKHLLILQKKVKWVKIVSPGELIEILS